MGDVVSDEPITGSKIRKEHVETASIEKLSLEGIDPKAEWPIDEKREKALVRKMDIKLVPWLCVISIITFIDRINIGNARIQGLEADLGLTGIQYNIALFIFFIPYILFEIPSNLILRWARPRWYVSFLVVVFGLATIGQGLVSNLGGLIGCRFLVGAAEAGGFPGWLLLTSMYYRRFELQKRVTFIFSASSLAGAFGGLLAYAIAKMDGIQDKRGWRWIFIIEGCITVFIGLLSPLFIPDFPDQTTFLNDDEKKLLATRLAVDNMGDVGRMDVLDRKAMKRAFSDYKIYVGSLLWLTVVTSTSSIAFFLPTILRNLGYTAERAQLFSIGPYVAAMISCNTAAYFSDRLNKRSPFGLAGTAVGSVGFIMLLAIPITKPAALVAATYLIMSAVYTIQSTILTWTTNNQSGHFKRAVNAGWTIGVGNISGIIASFIYPATQGPKFIQGYSICLSFMVLCGLTQLGFLWRLRWENRKRERGERDYRLNHPDLKNMGDDDPRFRFVY